jgi:chromosome partitioning protein
VAALCRSHLDEQKVPVWSGQITHRADFSLAPQVGEGGNEFASGSAAAREMAQLWSAIDRSVKTIHGACKNARTMHRVAA